MRDWVAGFRRSNCQRIAKLVCVRVLMRRGFMYRYHRLGGIARMVEITQMNFTTVASRCITPLTTIFRRIWRNSRYPSSGVVDGNLGKLSIGLWQLG